MLTESTIISLRRDMMNLARELKRFNDNNGKAIIDKSAWGDYKQACEILPMSKDWYREQRNGPNAKLIEGTDWRRRGKGVEYRLASVEALIKKPS